MPDADGAILLACKEPGCAETIRYERETVRGFDVSGAVGGTTVVYLTCPAPHTHRYEFTV